ncbi:hypothetical protein BS627_01140 [Agrobacterium salinitolerans]|uniref:hypothetical protein n=1 Tax=Agrobacterium salinitolerans TaxID=1183413 RepID=UPI00098FADB1|nr:hypothetical protein [Agrobacterium salinitolerans]OOO28793.1 hypothetical protein BS627_01140 [Agrobacterium salinitolerans]PNQ26349.1 hypothetical protein C2E26_01160 [Rhizobium sp. YIC5082]
MKPTSVAFFMLSIFGLLPIGANANEVSIIGSWRGNYAESCAAVKEESTEDFLKIGKKQIARYEGTCEITRQSKLKGTHVLQILCETEGETVRDTLKITPAGNDRINVEGAGIYERCK